MTKTRKKQASRVSNQPQRRPWWLLAGAGVLVVVLVAAYLVWQTPRAPAQSQVQAPALLPATPLPAQSPASQGLTQSPATAASPLTDDPALGPASAPVTLLEYGDFGCSTCRDWEQSGVPKAIRLEYGDQLRFVWRDFPVITPESPKAAEAGRCAYDQNKFWEYHDLLYAKAPALSVSDLKAYAAQLGLDSARFNQCLDSGQHKPTVDYDWQAALQLGFRGTPAFLINNQPVEGAPTQAYLESLINSKLAGG